LKFNNYNLVGINKDVVERILSHEESIFEDICTISEDEEGVSSAEIDSYLHRDNEDVGAIGDSQMLDIESNDVVLSELVEGNRGHGRISELFDNLEESLSDQGSSSTNRVYGHELLPNSQEDVESETPRSSKRSLESVADSPVSSVKQHNGPKLTDLLQSEFLQMFGLCTHQQVLEKEKEIELHEVLPVKRKRRNRKY